jgi:hypothetical protein
LRWLVTEQRWQQQHGQPCLLQWPLMLRRRLRTFRGLAATCCPVQMLTTSIILPR